MLCFVLRIILKSPAKRVINSYQNFDIKFEWKLFKNCSFLYNLLMKILWVMKILPRSRKPSRLRALSADIVVRWLMMSTVRSVRSISSASYFWRCYRTFSRRHRFQHSFQRSWIQWNAVLSSCNVVRVSIRKFDLNYLCSLTEVNCIV